MPVVVLFLIFVALLVIALPIFSENSPQVCRALLSSPAFFMVRFPVPLRRPLLLSEA